MTRATGSAARAGRGAPLRAAAIAGLLFAGQPATAAAPAPARAAIPPVARATPDPQPVPTGPEVDPASRSVAARARTNECGHQWNNMKRAGTAAGTTWKEFFRGCQAQR